MGPPRRARVRLRASVKRPDEGLRPDQITTENDERRALKSVRCGRFSRDPSGNFSQPCMAPVILFPP